MNTLTLNLNPESRHELKIFVLLAAMFGVVYFLPVGTPRFDGAVTEAELRIAQAQLIGWLEGLFHGIQASLWSQQMAAQSQLQEMQKRALIPPSPPGQNEDQTGLYL